jgi:hypothetical protein
MKKRNQERKVCIGCQIHEINKRYDELESVIFRLLTHMNLNIVEQDNTLKVVPDEKLKSKKKEVHSDDDDE